MSLTGFYLISLDPTDSHWVSTTSSLRELGMSHGQIWSLDRVIHTNLSSRFRAGHLFSLVVIFSSPSPVSLRLLPVRSRALTNGLQTLLFGVEDRPLLISSKAPFIFIGLIWATQTIFMTTRSRSHSFLILSSFSPTFSFLLLSDFRRR